MGGPRPQNNLNRQMHKAGLGSNQAATTKSRGGIQNQLQTETRRGGNIGEMPQATALEEDFTVPAAKRQKTEHHPSSPTSGRSEDDILDQIGPQGICWVPSQIASQALSSQSQETVLQMKRSGSSTGSLTEHKSLERMMNSDPMTKRKSRRANHQNQQQGHSLPLPPLKSSTASQPIDISGEDDEDIMDIKQSVALPKALYRGTARFFSSKKEIANTSKLIQAADSQHKSPYFPDKTSVGRTSNDPRTNGIAKQKASKQNQDQSERLASRFVADSGKRRGSHFNLSSDRDELDQTGNTVRPLAEVRASSPAKPSRQNSPSKQNHPSQQVASDTESQDGMERSTIEPSKWVSQIPKAVSDVSIVRVRPPKREADPPLAFSLAAIRIREKILTKSDFGLVYEAPNEIFRVQWNDAFLQAPNVSFSVDPKKLLRIDFGNSGGKIRFTSSKSGHDDNTLDLQFRNERDVTAIIKQLSNGRSFKITSHERYAFQIISFVPTASVEDMRINNVNSEYMDKVFERRREEFSKSQDLNDNSLSALQEVQIPAIKQTTPGTASVNIQRKSGGLVDNLYARATRDDDTTAPVRSERSKPIANADVTKHHGLIKQPEHNSHLRRSSRMSAASSKVSEDPFDAYPDIPGGFHDDVPLYERFSKVHGLGKTWNKPLTYPKAGKKKTTVDFSDLERLDEGEFLNDNLIGFYLRFLEQTFEEQKPDLAKRVYFFNTYFYTTLTNAHKPRKVFNYEGVQKWTRAVDIFTYDYIIIPICENTHWYLAVICNLPQLDRVAMPKEASSSQTEIGSLKAAEEQNEFSAPPSSPVDELDQRGTRSPGGNEFEPDEREATNSFAEMNLDGDTRKPATMSANIESTVTAETIYAHADDREMLDAQFEAIMPESTFEMAFDGPGRETTKQQIEEIEDLIEEPEQIAKANARTKKQKRKSMPPPVTNIDPSIPAIITFDSLGQTRSTTLRNLKQYLTQEAKSKRNMEVDIAQIKGINAKVPQQENFSDCGLFLLGYLSKFLEDDPKDFITKIIRRKYTREDWSKLDPSILRKSLREQIQELHNIQVAEQRSSAIKSGKYPADQKLQASPTLTAVGRTVEVSQDGQKDEAKRELAKDIGRSSTGKSTPQHSPSPKVGITDNLMAQLNRAATYFGEAAKETLLTATKDNKQAKDVTLDPGSKPQDTVAAANDQQRRAGTTRQRKPLEELPSIEPNEPSVIEIESQSQQDVSAPRSSRHSQPSPKKREPSELPSEVPDSQPSEAAKSFPQVIVPVQSPKRKAPDARSDRASRRKTTYSGLKSAGAEIIDVDD